MMDASRERRLVVLIGILAAGWLVLCGRLIDLQVIGHAYWSRLADQQQTQRSELRPPRGPIVDRDGRVLAQDLARCGLEAYPSQMTDPSRSAAVVAGLLSMPVDSLRAVFARRATYLRVSGSITPAAEEALTDTMTAWARHGRNIGLHMTHGTERVYPFAELARCVLGKTNPDAIGIEGLEYAFDTELRGAPGWKTVLRDGKNQVYPALMQRSAPALQGRGLELTLDMSMQAILEQAVRDAVARHCAKGGMGVIVDPHTGDVLAMVSMSRHDNAPGQLPRNRAVADQFEPGSTFKLVVASAAIQEGTVTPETPVFCENGNWAGCPGGRPLHDAHGGHGTLHFRDVFAKSSNIGSAKVALMVGSDRYSQYLRNFGFGERTGIGLEGEALGTVPSPQKCVGGLLTRVAIGQSVAVTPLQLAMAYAAIANDGELMAPRLVRGFTDADGRRVRETPVRSVRRVVSPQTARTVRSFLAAVVDSGTARQAQLDFGPAGGKTGTAQKPNVGSRGYSDKFFASFVGMAPVDKPALVCAIIIDEPTAGGHYGGVVAAPVWKQVIESISRLPGAPLGPNYREVGSDVGDWAGAVPPATLSALAPAAAAATLSHEPLPAYLPSLKGRPIRDAYARLGRAGLLVKVVGTGVVVSQTPPAGTPLGDVSTVVLRCRPDAPVVVDAFADSALVALAMRRLASGDEKRHAAGDSRE